MEEQVKIKILVKASNVIIVRSGDILVMSVEANDCKIKKNEAHNLHMMKILI